jgi:hypothetical protein
MIFRVQPPSPSLACHVEYFWYHEGLVSDYAMERLVPDGGVELIIDLTPTPKATHEKAGTDCLLFSPRCHLTTASLGEFGM